MLPTDKQDSSRRIRRRDLPYNRLQLFELLLVGRASCAPVDSSRPIDQPDPDAVFAVDTRGSAEVGGVQVERDGPFA